MAAEAAHKAMLAELAIRARERGIWRVAVVAMLLPWFVFVLAGLIFILCFHHLPVLVLLMVVSFIAVCFQSSALSWVDRRRDRAHAIALCALAACTGTMAGGFVHSGGVHDYWAFNKKGHYTNAKTSTLADAFRDASMIAFAGDAQPNSERSAGYRGPGGQIYCVAPILARNPATVGEDTIQYWAAGMDCCDKGRGAYTCDDVDVPGVHHGLVIYNKTNPFSDALGLPRAVDHYLEAARIASARYPNLAPPAEEPIFLRWISDLEAGRHNLWWGALALWLRVSVMYLILCILLGLTVPSLLLGVLKQDVAAVASNGAGDDGKRL